MIFHIPLLSLPCFQDLVLLWQPQRWQIQNYWWSISEITLFAFHWIIVIQYWVLLPLHPRMYRFASTEIVLYWLIVEKQKQQKLYFFWARSNSAQHHTLPKQSNSLSLVPLGEQLIGSHLKKPRYSPVHHSHHLGNIKPKKSHTCHRTI